MKFNPGSLRIFSFLEQLLMITLSGDSDQLEQITHTVPFKSIGSAHEKNYQHP